MKTKEKLLSELVFERYKQLQVKIAKEVVEESKHCDVPPPKLFLLKWLNYVSSN